MKYKFNNNEEIVFDNGIVTGKGKIVGCSVVEQPIVGATYLVEVETCYDSLTFETVSLPSETYPFEVIAINECSIQSLS